MEGQPPAPETRVAATFFDALRECLHHVQECRDNDAMTKDDVLEQMESRISRMLTKMIATPTATSFCVFRRDVASPSV